VYVPPNHEDKVDYFVRQLALPHYLEWHFFNSHYNDDASYDMDGIICEDFDLDTLDFDIKYLTALQTRPPKYLPRNKAISIITGRRECYRNATMYWLKQHKVEVKTLIMAQESMEYLHAAEFKAKHITSKIYVESCIHQATRIKELRPEITVICPAHGAVL
jgi:hypothetical protein